MAEVRSGAAAAEVQAAVRRARRDAAAAADAGEMTAKQHDDAVAAAALAAAAEYSAAGSRTSGPRLPSRLVIVTAVMLLFKLSFTLEAHGALIRTLLNEVLRGVFENYAPAAECAVGSAFVLKEDHPTADDADCSFLLGLSTFFDEIVAARERADAAYRSSEQVRRALLAASNVARRLIERSVRERLRTCFLAWRRDTRRARHARAAIESAGWHGQRRRLLRKTFLDWRLAITLSRELRMLELSARNSEHLTTRSRELAHRIETREAELTKQRQLKESYVLKSERVEGLMASLREDLVRTRAKLLDAEARARGAFETACGLVKRLELSHLNRAAVGPVASLELEGEVTARRLINPAAPLRDPFVHIQAVAESRPWRVGNPQSFLVAWINDVIDRMALGQLHHGNNPAAIAAAAAAANAAAAAAAAAAASSSTRSSPGASPSASLHASYTSAGAVVTLATAAALQQQQLAMQRISALVPDLCNGKVYAALFNFLGISPGTMTVQFESEGERRAAIVKAAAEDGIDCLLRPEDLAKEDELPHMALCLALFSRYCAQQAVVSRQDDIVSVPELVERTEALLRSTGANRRWSELQQILASTVSGMSVQRCLGVVKGTAMTGLAGFTTVTITTVRTLRPPAMKFSDDAAEDEARCERLAVSMQSCMSALRGIVLDAFFYYASFVSTDSLDPYTLDRTAWRKLLGDNKLLPTKRSSQHSELLLDLFDHPGFPLLSAIIPPPSPVILNIEDWLVAIVRVFFARVEVSRTPTTALDALGNLFRTFVVENICKDVGLLRHAEFVAEFGSPDLQNTLRQYRDPLRRIYNELTAAPPNRFRLDMFVHLATRLKVPLDPELELPHCFASARVALTDRGTIATARTDVGALRGVDFNGFCALVYVLSQAKMGGNPFAMKGSTLEAFLTTCFFVHFQGRVPLLRW
jgi:hypothetical protein